MSASRRGDQERTGVRYNGRASPAADDLLELDHRIDGAHQDDVADVSGIDARRELLR